MASTPTESGLLLEERRELTMHGPALLEALLEFDRVHNGWLWRATEHSLSIKPGETPPVVVEAKRSEGNDVSRAEFSIGHIAATFIHLCRTLKIPMPRNSRKEVKLADDGATLILHLSAPMPLRHSHAFAAAPIAAKRKAAVPATGEPGAEPGAPSDAVGADSPAAAEAGADSAAPDAAAEDSAAESEAPAPVAAAG